MTRLTRRVGWIAGLSWSTWLLDVLPIGRLGEPAAPATHRLTATWTWAQSADPASVALAGLRLLAGAVSAYLLLASLLLALISLSPRRVASALSHIVPATTRRLIAPAMGLAIIATSPDITTVASQLAGPPATATIELVEEPVATATFRWAGPVSPGSSSGPLIAEHPDGSTAAPESENTPHDVWLVEPGDHFWSIAARTLDHAAPGEGLAEHWRTLIELNRDQLPDPNNPDLILPGMELRLR